ncbi:hypothetical protein ACNFIA_09560 [Pseudomonas sp. NY15437]|uniref:hypothetical protein n=1 Tax=Pseudomonas sp. NY15437 TaxID=3400360 RepID=UPI003A85E056
MNNYPVRPPARRWKNILGCVLGGFLGVGGIFGASIGALLLIEQVWPEASLRFDTVSRATVLAVLLVLVHPWLSLRLLRGHPLLGEHAIVERPQRTLRGTAILWFVLPHIVSAGVLFWSFMSIEWWLTRWQIPKPGLFILLCGAATFVPVLGCWALADKLLDRCPRAELHLVQLRRDIIGSWGMASAMIAGIAAMFSLLMRQL